MVVITLSEIIHYVIIGLIIIGFILACVISYITNTYKEKSNKWHNCYECKHFEFTGVPSVGNNCYYKCKITGNRYTEDVNYRIKYEKCKNFENKE